MKFRSSILVLIGIVLVAGCMNPHQPEVASAPMTEFEETGQTRDGFGWTNQPWTGDDAPYQAVRTAIDRALARGAKPQKLIAAYKAAAEYDSQNPLAVFGWAYARYEATQCPKVNVNPNLWDVPAELAQVPQPHTYNSVRLRFLAQAQGRDTNPLRGVGERLLARDPKDKDVALFLVELLRQFGFADSDAEAKTVTEALVAQAPNMPLYHQLLANVYGDIYTNEGYQPKDAELAIASYQDFLRLAPKDDPYRQPCVQGISWLRGAEVMDWTPARLGPPQMAAPPKPLVPPLPAFKYPTGPGQPSPPAPLR